MNTTLLRLAVWGSGFSLLVLISAARAAEPEAFSPLQIRGDMPEIKQGDPLSSRTLVTKPPTINGVFSWTIESKKHRGSMMCLALSPDGKTIATGGIDGMVRLWDAQTGKPTRVLVGHDSYVSDLSWSRCGNVLASAGTWDGTVRLWAPAEGRPLRVLRGLKTPVHYVGWSPDNTKLLAATGHSGALWLWNARSEEGKVVIEIGQYIRSPVWNPDSKTIALVGTQMPVSIYDLEVGKATKAFQVPPEEVVTSMTFTPDGKQLVTGSTIRTTTWDIETQQPVKKLEGYAYCVACSPDGKKIAVGVPAAVQLWDPATGKTGAKLPTLSTPIRLLWHNASKKLACISTTHFATWDLDGKLLKETDVGGSQPPIWTPGRPVVNGIGTKTLTLWDSQTGKYLRTLEPHKAAVTVVAWNRDGKTLASAGADQLIHLWDTTNGKEIAQLKGHTSVVTSLAWAPSGKLLASGSADKTVRLWETDGDAAQKLEGHEAAVDVVSWTPMGNLLASGSRDKKVILWNPKSGEEVRTLPAYQPVQSIAWTMVERVLVIACGTADENIRIMNAGTGQSLLTLTLRGSPPNVSSLCWMPSASGLLAGRGNHTVQLWDVQKSKTIHSIGAMAPVLFVNHANNGGIIVAGVQDRSVRFYDAATATLRGVLIDEEGNVAIVGADGNWRTDNEKTADLMAVAQMGAGQACIPLTKFAAEFRYKNNPARVKLVPR